MTDLTFVYHEDYKDLKKEPKIGIRKIEMEVNIVKCLEELFKNFTKSISRSFRYNGGGERWMLEY